jgi:hypothetical protein
VLILKELRLHQDCAKSEGSEGYTPRLVEKSAEMIEGEGDGCWPSRKGVRNRLKRNGLNQTHGQNIGARVRGRETKSVLELGKHGRRITHLTEVVKCSAVKSRN